MPVCKSPPDFGGIRAWLEEKRRQRALRNIRETFFGFPLDHYSDQDLELRIVQLAVNVSKVGITAEEAVENFRRSSGLIKWDVVEKRSES
jgi:hypothetical protein